MAYDSTPPSPQSPGGPPVWVRLAQAGTGVLVAAAVALALVLLALGFVAARGLDLFPSWGNPLAETTVERSEAPLQLSLSDLSEYHAAAGTFQVVLDLERDRRFVPSFISGERTVFLATGSVDGFVDFSQVGPERVVVDQETRSVTINLPAPRLAKPVVDLGASRVLARERGILDRAGSAFTDNPGSEQAFYQLAEQRLAEAAEQSDVRKRAEDNTRAMLTSLAGSLGFENVTVNFEPPPA